MGRNIKETGGGFPASTRESPLHSRPGALSYLQVQLSHPHGSEKMNPRRQDTLPEIARPCARLWCAKLWSVLAGVLACALSVGATPLRENFEGTFPPPEWLIWQDGQGTREWQRSSQPDPAWGYSAFSPLDAPPPLTSARRWLVTPPLFPDSAHASLTFHLRTQDPPNSGDDTDACRAAIQFTLPRRVLISPLCAI